MTGRKRAVAAGLAAAVALVAIVAFATTRLLASHVAPSALALSSKQSAVNAAIAGKWSVGPGSAAGYRAKEKFINQPAKTEAVARTSQVSGGLVVNVDGTTVKVSQVRITVDLASLTSQDRYATYQVYQRDFFVRTIYLDTSHYPTATFASDGAQFAMPSGGPATVDISGKLTVHGLTKTVTAHLQAVDDGSRAEVAGSIDVDMRDFAIDPPDISFTHAEPAVTIEFDLKLERAP